MSSVTQVNFVHGYGFDPTYGYDLEKLLAVEVPCAPTDFAAFWQARYAKALALDPRPQMSFVQKRRGFDVYDMHYQSTDGVLISGWLLLPVDQVVTQAIVISHGYGGRDDPDFHLKIPGTALLFPCARGISRSSTANIPSDPANHVLHGLHSKHSYVLGGCVEDLWLAVSSLLIWFPQLENRIGLMGISFGGGIGALALPWDRRIGRAHFNGPSFGHQALRLRCPSIGSACAVQQYAQRNSNVIDTLIYYDAAVAASMTAQPVHMAAALFDPVVAPPGQFAIYNAYPNKHLFVLEAGHFEYAQALRQQVELNRILHQFFLG